jgi:nucleotide-binding universal stress UspA family protein
MKRILIAIDYNPTAQKVAETGYALAKAMSAHLTLLHVISDPIDYASATFTPIMGFIGYPDIDLSKETIIEEMTSATFLFLDKIKKHLGDKTIKTEVRRGDFADTILKTAKEGAVDFIVMGSHSHKWLEEILMGSVTKRVLRDTLLPIASLYKD